MSNQKLADALRALMNRYVLANPPDHNGAEMIAAREALAEHDTSSFSDEMCALADRVMAFNRSTKGPMLSLRQVELHVRFAKLAIAIGQDAHNYPQYYQEPQA